MSAIFLALGWLWWAAPEGEAPPARAPQGATEPAAPVDEGSSPDEADDAAPEPDEPGEAATAEAAEPSEVDLESGSIAAPETPARVQDQRDVLEACGFWWGVT